MIRLLPILLTSCKFETKNLSTRKKEKYLYKLVENCFKLVEGNYFDFFVNVYNFIDSMELNSINKFYNITNLTYEDMYPKIINGVSTNDDNLLANCLIYSIDNRLIDTIEFKYGKYIYETIILFKSNYDKYSITLNLNNLERDDLKYIENNKYLLNDIGECMFKEYIRNFIVYYIESYNIDISHIQKLGKKYNLLKSDGGWKYICL